MDLGEGGRPGHPVPKPVAEDRGRGRGRVLVPHMVARIVLGPRRELDLVTPIRVQVKRGKV